MIDDWLKAFVLGDSESVVICLIIRFVVIYSITRIECSYLSVFIIIKVI